MTHLIEQIVERLKTDREELWRNLIEAGFNVEEVVSAIKQCQEAHQMTQAQAPATSVYVKPVGLITTKEHCTWQCSNSDEARRLAKWLREMGLNAHQIDQETFDAMP